MADSSLCPHCGKHGHASEGEALRALGRVRARRHTQARRQRKALKRAENHVYGPCPEGYWHLSSH